MEIKNDDSIALLAAMAHKKSLSSQESNLAILCETNGIVDYSEI
jgi:hypothetical protein